MPFIKKEIEVDFEVFCNVCGAPLCRSVQVSGDRIYVEPCGNCIKNKLDELREELVEEFKNEAKNE